jgi:hypothetical protein
VCRVSIVHHGQAKGQVDRLPLAPETAARGDMRPGRTCRNRSTPDTAIPCSDQNRRQDGTLPKELKPGARGDNGVAHGSLRPACQGKLVKAVETKPVDRHPCPDAIRDQCGPSARLSRQDRLSHNRQISGRLVKGESTDFR